MLEQALKTYPASHSDRWDRIAECVPGRNKKECMARFKVIVPPPTSEISCFFLPNLSYFLLQLQELAALIKAKKMAQKK